MFYLGRVNYFIWLFLELYKVLYMNQSQYAVKGMELEEDSDAADLSQNTHGLSSASATCSPSPLIYFPSFVSLSFVLIAHCCVPLIINSEGCSSLLS